MCRDSMLLERREAVVYHEGCDPRNDRCDVTRGGWLNFAPKAIETFLELKVHLKGCGRTRLADAEFSKFIPDGVAIIPIQDVTNSRGVLHFQCRKLARKHDIPENGGGKSVVVSVLSPGFDVDSRG